MIDVELAGIGTWSDAFSSWDDFRALLRGESVERGQKPQPALIPPRERRRAPGFVKMAVEVMDQASRMTGVDPGRIATVFASSMGDMQMTDYMCRTMVTDGRLLSPTKFHNSVHNASTGYWSISTHSHAPANAVSGHRHSAAIAVLEGAVQAIEEDTPVLVVAQEAVAPVPLRHVCDIEHACTVALLLMPPGQCGSPLASLRLSVSHGEFPETAIPPLPNTDLSGNFAARLLPFLYQLATGDEISVTLMLSRHATLSISAPPADAAHTVDA